MRVYALLVVIGFLVLDPTRASAGIEVLLKSGDAAPDGRVFSSFAGANAPSAKKVAFLGGTSAIITKSGSTFSLVAKTGDPLPAPLTGSFNSFGDPVINDLGNMVFRAALNSTGAEVGLFYCCDAGAIVPITLRGGSLGGLFDVTQPPDLNNNAEVVFMDRISGDIYRWSLAVPFPIQVADDGGPSPGGGTFFRFGNRPVLNNAGEVAFEADVSGGPDGIFIASPANVVSALALEGAATPIPGGTYAGIAPATAVAINDYGEVAFVANVALPGPDTTGVFLSYSSFPTMMIAREGDLVGASTLTSIDDEFVGIDAVENVAFEGIAGGIRQLILGSGGPLSSLAAIASSSEFAPRLTPSHGIVWRRGGSTIERLDGITSTVTTVVTSADTTPIGSGTLPREPSINASDVVAFRASQSALYTLDRGALTRIAAPGEVGPGGDTILSIQGLAYRGSSLAFFVDETSESLIALKKGSGPIRQVVRSGDAAPGGGTFALNQSLFDVRGSKVLFASDLVGGAADSGIFRANVSSGQVETVVLKGDPSPTGSSSFNAFLSVIASGNDATIVADLVSGARGIFVSNRYGLITVALDGDVLPDTGGGTLASLSSVAATSNRVAFIASVDNGTVPDGLFLWDHGQTRRIVSEGDPAGLPGATFGSLDLGPLEFGSALPMAVSSVLTFVAPITSGTASTGIFTARGFNPVAPLFLDDTPTPLGGTIEFLELAEPISRVGSSVVLFRALTSPSGVASALMRVKP